MFVPVACLKCGKAFQVSAADAGKDVHCPWCQASTPALPIAAVPTTDQSPAAAEEPLSLDDAPENVPHVRVATPVRRRTGWRLLLKIAIVFTLSVIVFFLSVAGLMLATGRTLTVYGSGHIPESAWQPFESTEGRLTLLLPGDPQVEAIKAHPTVPAIGAGQRFVVRGWYSRATTWVAWCDLDPAWAKDALADRDGALTMGLIGVEAERIKKWLEGTVTRDVVVRLDSLVGAELHYDTPRGKAIVRVFVAPAGPQPRLYVIGIESKTASPESPSTRKLFNSFHTIKE